MQDLLLKAAAVSAVALASFSSFPSIAQQQPAQPQQEPQVQQPTTAAPAGTQSQPGTPSAASAATAADLKSVTGELVEKLDTKSAKQGDSVVVKTSEDLKVSGGADIPKGSKLVGHVTNVEARGEGEGKENSQIAIKFDKAELKGGQIVAIESVIQAVSPAPSSGMDNSVPNAPSALGTSPASPNMPGGATSSPSMNGSTTTNSGSVNQNSNRPGGDSTATSQAGQTDQAPNGGMPAPGTIVARNGNVAIRTTSIPGVLLANALNGMPFSNASGLLLGARRDIHLDEGTRMVVAVAGNPQTGGGLSR
jgi:hypothetical protein